MIALTYLVVSNVSPAFADNPSAFVPPDGNVLVFVGQDKNTLAQYKKEVDIAPAGVMFYTSIQDMEGLYRSADKGGGVQNARWLTREFPDSALQIGLYMVNALDRVVTGVYDENIEKLAEFFKSHPRPFYLRIGYEFDNPSNKYIPEKYIEAYRYIANNLRGHGVDNVAYVWHAHGQIYAQQQMDWYPGDEFVDWVGLSYFSPFNEDGMKRVVDLAHSLNKPIMIAEATPIKLNFRDGHNAWKRWFPFVERFIKENNVQAFCYINSHWDRIPMFKQDKWGDARVQINPVIRERWESMIANPPFINASKELFGTLGYSPSE